MLAIHGIWAHGVLSLWAEDSGQPSAPAAGQRRGPARAPRLHPFAASAGLLADVIAEFGESASDLIRKATEGELTLWLPSVTAGPVPSPDLAGAMDTASPSRTAGKAEITAAVISATDSTQPTASNLSGSRGSRSRLSPWQVPALSLDPAAALALLALLGSPDARAERAVLSGSVHYLSALAALAADLTARGRVLPGVAEAAPPATEDAAGMAQGANGAQTAGRMEPARRYFARWRPVLAGGDALRARELTAALPPVCRATSAEGEPSAAI